MKKRLAASLLSLLAVFAPVFSVGAQDLQATSTDTGFDPNLVLTDDDVFDVRGLSYDRLVSFLRVRGPLADYRARDIDGTEKPAPDIIWRVANSYKINPKFLLALLQKEQSLVEDTNPAPGQYDWAAGFGVCDDCSKNDPAIQDYKGFANQLEYAAKQMRERNYLRLLSNGQTRAGYAPGKTANIDSTTVTPVNLATASLYTYTPHIHGNLNLWRIWQRWFSKNFPDGTVARGKPSGKVWWIKHGLKRLFASKTVAMTLVDMDKVVDVSDTELASYDEGPAISFPNYSLLREPDGEIWLLSGNEKRHIRDMKTFRALGFNLDEVEDVEAADLAAYETGAQITPASKYPQGRLLKDAKTGETWYVEAGERSQIKYPSLLTLYFKNRRPKTVASSVISGLVPAEPYSLRDGELVKAAKVTAVYVIEYGKRRPIPNAETFESLGWKWKNVVTLPPPLLDGYPLGDPILLDIPQTQTQLATADQPTPTPNP